MSSSCCRSRLYCWRTIDRLWRSTAIESPTYLGAIQVFRAAGARLLRSLSTPTACRSIGQ
jgi:hypothetical protein